MSEQTKLIDRAAEILKRSKYTIAFSGAGISVESGIPPFRGDDGIWSKYDPSTLELDFFFHHPKRSWKVIRDIFYSYFDNAGFNDAHRVLARMENEGMLKSIVTQNIDNLHQEAGSSEVYEFHGNSKKIVCTGCHSVYAPSEIDFNRLPPYCEKCSSLLKPDFIFFGEQIPMGAYEASISSARQAEVILVIGTTGEVMPASQIPYIAKQNEATVIEVNPTKTNYTGIITDIFLEGKATSIMNRLEKHLF